jgi:regulatory protein
VFIKLDTPAVHSINHGRIDIMAYGNYGKKKKYVPYDPDAVLTEDDLKKLRVKARNLCFYYLTKTDKTRKELQQRLYQKHIPADIIEDTLNELENDGYVNDEKYANNFVRIKTEYGNLGKNGIKQKLSQKGVDRNIIDEATSDIDNDEEFEKAKELAQTRLRSTHTLDPQKRYIKLVSFVLRRGYGADVTYKAVREAIDEEDPEDYNY